MIHRPDLDLLRTHDDAQAMLRYLATGARVTFARVPLRAWDQDNAPEATRSFVLTMDRVGGAPLTLAESYSLPCPAAQLRAHVVAQLERGLKG